MVGWLSYNQTFYPRVGRLNLKPTKIHEIHDFTRYIEDYFVS